MPFDDDRVYLVGDLQIDGLPEDSQRAMAELAEAQRAGEAAWETVDGVRQLTAGGVVFLPDENDVPSPGSATGSLGCLMFFMAGAVAVQLLFISFPHRLSSPPVSYIVLAATISLVGFGLMVRGIRLSKRPKKHIFRTGAYLFPKTLVFVKGGFVTAAFPKARILFFYKQIFTKQSERTYVRYRAPDGEEAVQLLAASEWCARLERWRTGGGTSELETSALTPKAHFEAQRSARAPEATRAVHRRTAIIVVVGLLVGGVAAFYLAPRKATTAMPTVTTSPTPSSTPASAPPATRDAPPGIATLVATYGADLLARPLELAFDPGGNMYVSDSTGRLQQLDPNGKPVRVIPVPDRKEGRNGIYGLACNSSDALYVSRGHEVLKLSLKDGSVLSTVKEKRRVDSAQPLPDELCARGIAVDASNNLYVANNCTPEGMNMDVVDPYSVTKLDAKGKVLGHWNDMDGVETTMAVDSAGRLYRSYKDEVYVHDPNGHLMNEWGRSGDDTGDFFHRPTAIAVDGRGHVYLMDFSGHVGVYDAKGNWRGTFGDRGRTLVVGPGGDVYVLDDTSIQRYRLTHPD